VNARLSIATVIPHPKPIGNLRNTSNEPYFKGGGRAAARETLVNSPKTSQSSLRDTEKVVKVTHTPPETVTQNGTNTLLESGQIPDNQCSSEKCDEDTRIEKESIISRSDIESTQARQPNAGARKLVHDHDFSESKDSEMLEH
jgi:hypothetical protein